MTCLDFEKLIALDAEGDLPERKAAKLGEHLRACRDCQEFTARLQASQALLKSLAQESADEAVLQEVRQRVLAGIATAAEPHYVRAWQFALGAALAAMAMFAAVNLWHPSGPRYVARESRPPSRERPAPARTGGQSLPRAERGDTRATAGETLALQRVRETSQHASTEAMSSAPTVPEHARAQTERAKQVLRERKEFQGSLSASVKPRAREPLTVMLVSDNPNVVIYWLVD
jgi:hypothetical protein